MKAWAERRAAELQQEAPQASFPPPSVPYDELDGSQLSCAPYTRSLGEGGTLMTICPILNGLWTSFHDRARWPSAHKPLPAASAQAISVEMRLYDKVGLSNWIGEDFDERVLSALEAHRTSAPPAGAGSASSVYSIIVERQQEVLQGLSSIEERLGKEAVRWVQLGPPALDHLPKYRLAHVAGRVHHYGVEDYTTAMLQKTIEAFPVATVQQEINLLVRPKESTLSLCRDHGCRFIAYGPLLGGLLSDAYLNVKTPQPDADHTKQVDYLQSIVQWGGWAAFQRLLGVLRRVGDAHGGASIAAVSLAYLLQLPYVLAAIVGVRIGHSASADHRRENLEALALELSAAEVAEIDKAVAFGQVSDGLART